MTEEQKAPGAPVVPTPRASVATSCAGLPIVPSMLLGVVLWDFELSAWIQRGEAKCL